MQCLPLWNIERGWHISACAKMYMHVQKCTSFINKKIFPRHERKNFRDGDIPRFHISAAAISDVSTDLHA